MHRRGTTVLEIVIYLGLFGLLMTSSILIFVHLLQGSSRLELLIHRDDEALFVLEKIGNALAAGGTITAPAVSSSAHALTITSLDGAPTIFSLYEERMTLARGTGDPAPITASDIRASVFDVTRSASSLSVLLIIDGVQYEQIF